ncbi:MAG: transcriptional regulator [Clostridiales bacterium GWF2_36_10]|nr:MAG: transcriptional regulator [Clostridiales bacterium GWF2_36_10]HAN20107.1 TetR/AcrR family transcriptional regulator [Clostridiales bacterium]
MATRSEQKEKRRQDILAVGLDLFIRKGYAATKISDIAKAANMSVGLLFHYFESKEKLYEELIKIGISGPEMIMSGDKSDPLKFFEATTMNILEYVKDPFTAKMFVLMSQAMYTDSDSENVREMLKQNNTYLQSTALIEKGQQNGTIREGNPIALSIAFWAAIQGICQAVAVDSNTPCPLSEWIVDIIKKK